MLLVWDEAAWDDYLWWQTEDRRVLKRINQLIKDVERNGNEGIGKPEALRHGLSGYWSRRITDEHRLVYKVVDDQIKIASCRYHYGRGPGARRQPPDRQGPVVVSQSSCESSGACCLASGTLTNEPQAGHQNVQGPAGASSPAGP